MGGTVGRGGVGTSVEVDVNGTELNCSSETVGEAV
jgi:hypothetical protein